MDAQRITIECEEDGFWLVLRPETEHEPLYGLRVHIEDPEALYDHVKTAIEPWLREQDEARTSRPFTFSHAPEGESGYDLSDPKHPDYHDTMSEVWDSRPGK